MNSTIAQAASDATSDGQLQGDYVPCKFTLPQLRTLISPEIAPTLTPADEANLKQEVIAAAISQRRDPAISPVDVDGFIAALSLDPLHGLTPDQALNQIIQLLSANRTPPAVQDSDFVTLQATLEKALPDDASVIESYIKFLRTKLLGIPRVSLQDSALAQWRDYSTENKIADSASSQIRTVLAGMTKADTTRIVDAARAAVGLLERPPDIGCAMSILTYDETKQAFGYLIARTYIAVQVVVRNLNRTQSFVLHDVEFEVNEDPTGRLGRFFSGRDKVIVRALSSTQNSFDPRNITVHSAMGISAIMSAAVPIFGNASLTNAAAVFTGAFVPGLDKYWKDQSTDQLNLLNDTGFSSQASSQTVVPQSGTVMFVTFVPSKQFEEGWWTQRCVDKMYLGTTDRWGNVTNLATNDSGYLREQSPDDTHPIGVHSSNYKKKHKLRDEAPGIGIDPARALEVCQWELASGLDPLPAKDRNKILQLPTSGTSVTTGADALVDHETNVDLFRNAYPSPYRKWNGNSLTIFRELSNVVVSGTHIIEDSQLLSTVSALNCTLDSSGTLVFPTPEKDTMACPVAGKNLDKISKLRLRNAKDATDTSTAEGNVSVNGDSSNATVTFVSSALHGLTQPAYDVFTVSGQGVEQKTTISLHLPTEPYVSQVSPTSIDYSKDKTPQFLTIIGNHLQSVDTVTLSTADGSKKVSVPLKQDALKSDTKLLVEVDPSALSVFRTAKTPLSITLAEGSKPFPTTQTFDYTGTASPKQTASTANSKAAAPAASSSSPSSFDFTKDNAAKPLTIVGTNLSSVQAIVLTSAADNSKKVSIPVVKGKSSSASQLVVQIDPAKLTVFGTTKTAITVAFMVGSDSVTTNLHFDYVGSLAKAK